MYDRDRLGLFADTAGLLAAQGHIVRSAVVRTLDGVAANEWHVETPGGGAPDEGVLVRGLTRLAGGDREPLAMLARRRRATRLDSSRATSGSPGQTRAMVISHASDSATVIEVRAADRPGLLHDIGITLSRARSASGAPTSPRMPARRSTRSTSPSSAAGRCRRPGGPGGVDDHRHLCGTDGVGSH